MTAPAELRGNFVHVHFVAFRAETDAREFRFDFFKNARDNDRFDGANVVNESLRVHAFGAGAGEINFFQPEPCNTVVVREVETIVDMFEQPRARQRIGLINFVANFGEVRAARDQFRAGVKRAGPRRGILK